MSECSLSADAGAIRNRFRFRAKALELRLMGDGLCHGFHGFHGFIVVICDFSCTQCVYTVSLHVPVVDDHRSSAYCTVLPTIINHWSIVADSDSFIRLPRPDYVTSPHLTPRGRRQGRRRGRGLGRTRSPNQDVQTCEDYPGFNPARGPKNTMCYTQTADKGFVDTTCVCMYVHTVKQIAVRVTAILLSSNKPPSYPRWATDCLMIILSSLPLYRFMVELHTTCPKSNMHFTTGMSPYNTVHRPNPIHPGQVCPPHTGRFPTVPRYRFVPPAHLA
ncbi:hypothetical protein K504DRAFT_48227 [Pleomassaria siparia CBS 279.74]|uniref:Uncharacterized protein n=1 Tax=Pleomassaria siparia CBS 279.74 TaxID=1314801 RepID=A0A6G1K2H1_9PLEO|nr:hypothetical protein K504DRAFT_48227 [Pleomassaria siparia CBS 279.74]